MSDILLQIKFIYLVIMSRFNLKNQRKTEETNFLEIDNQQISYVKTGNGKKTIILLHGWGQSKEVWSSVQKILKKNYTVYSIDLPGFGQSNINKVLNLSDYVQFLQSFLRHEKIKSCTLIGHSFGGKVSALFALRYPHAVDKLVLYSVSFNIFRTKDKTSFSVSYLFVSRIIRWSLEIYTLLTSKSLSQSILLLKTYRNTHRGTDFKNPSSIKQKSTLLLYGAHDHIVPLYETEKIFQSLPNAKKVIFPSSTHLAHLEKTSEFINTIKEFIYE